MSQAQFSHEASISHKDILAKPIGDEELGELVVTLQGDETATAPLRAGTVMGKITSSGLYVPYDDSGSDGEEVARGVLSEDIPAKNLYTTASNGTKTKRQSPVTLYTKGTVFESALTGIDANGKSDLANMTFV